MIINVDDNNIRIDKYLIDKLSMSRSKLQKMINNGNVLVNGNPVKNSYIVKEELLWTVCLLGRIGWIKYVLV